MPTNKERIARLEEQVKTYGHQFEKQTVACASLFKEIQHKLEVVNIEQGETRDAIKEIQVDMKNNLTRLEKAIAQNGEKINKTINKKVSGSQMSGRDRTLLWATTITAIFGFLSAIIPELLRFFGT